MTKQEKVLQLLAQEFTYRYVPSEWSLTREQGAFRATEERWRGRQVRILSTRPGCSKLEVWPETPDNPHGSCVDIECVESRERYVARCDELLDEEVNE